MKKNKMMIFAVMLLIATLVCCGCAQGASGAPSQAADEDYVLRQQTNELAVCVGDTGDVEYTYTGTGTVEILSSNTEVLQVEDGRWVAVAAGTAVITCTDGVRNSQCLVTVTEAAPGA